MTDGERQTLQEVKVLTELLSKEVSEMNKTVTKLNVELLLPSAKGEPPFISRINSTVKMIERGNAGAKFAIWGLLTLGAVLTALSEIRKGWWGQ